MKIRFEALTPFLKMVKVSLTTDVALDTYFLFIESQKEDIDYHGVDIITDFIKANKLKYPHGKFFTDY